ncbi:MAG TPA: aspartyl protease family protein [Candidatus Baltobacteraceae bacterium]|nr:aspartyl protease family protein [Candidatus Baltobacteraceae bacterium]
MRIWVSATILAVVFAVSSAQAAQTYTPTSLTAQQVFAKARAARGHLKPGAYHSVYERTRGDSTTSIDVYEAPLGFMETEREGAFTWANGSYKGTNWSQDENGVVTLDSDFETVSNPFITALSRTPGENSGVRVLGVTTTQPACVVVQVAPRSGLVQQRYYDAKTFLLRRVVTTDYRNLPWTYDYGDYATQYGLTFAQTVTYSDSHPENTTVTRSKLFERIAPAAMHLAIPKTRPLFGLPSDAPVQIPAEFTPDGIIVRVTIQGRGLDFQLDSGAGNIVLDASVARQLGLSVIDVHKGTFSGDFSIGRSIAPDFAVGTLHAGNVAINTIPFERMVGDRKVVGLLGGDFFASQRVEVNFKQSALTIAPSSSVAPSGDWTAIPIEVDDMVPRAHAKFNAVDGAFIVDLGADDTMLYPHFFRQFKPNRAGDVMGQMVGIAGQGVDYRQYTFSRFDFGDLAFADATADVTSGTKFEEIDYDGLLGRNILANFNLVFDYAAGRLYVQPLIQ